MDPKSRVYVAGHRGLVGSAIVRRLRAEGYENLLLPSRDELDLLDPVAVHSFFNTEWPHYVFVAAARVGGILANSSYPADFIRENLLIETNLFEAARRNGIHKLLFLGSSCIYPKLAPQPIQESALLSGPLEPTNEWYAVAKIAGIKLGQAYRMQYGMNAISLIPTNLYGPGDNFDLESSHVLPALIRRFHEAKVSGADKVVLWGTGTPRREFLHVDDLADACVFLMHNYESTDPINVGTGEDLTIAELAAMVRDIVGYQGEITYDETKPDGTPRKLLDVSHLTAMGWKPRIRLEDGIRSTYEWFLTNVAPAGAR